VNFTIPVVATIAFLLLVAFREIARLLVRRVPHRFVWAAITIIASLVLSNSVPAQHEEPLTAIVGTVQSVSGNLIHVKSGAQLLTLHVDDHTEIWKGKVLRDLSPLEIGDDIWSRCRKDASGKLVAEAIWINIVNFFGVITRVNGNTFEVLTNPNADPLSAYKKEYKLVRFDADTIFESSEKDDLKVGREVQTVGLHLRNGIVKATRVTIYEGKRPVRLGKAKVIGPDGTIFVIDR